MRLSRSSDYALRALLHLASLPSGDPVSGSVIATATGVGESFLLKILRQLVRARLIKAQPGVHGGFRLNLPADQISMLRVIEAVDGPLDSGTCLQSDWDCSHQSWCGIQQVLADLHRHASVVLGSTTIAALVRENQNRPQPVVQVEAQAQAQGSPA